MSKLDATEADIAKMTEEINKVHEVIETTEAKINSLNEDELLDKQVAENQASDGDDLKVQAANLDSSGPLKADASNEEETEVQGSKPDQKRVNVKVTNYSPAKLAGLEVISW